MAIQARQVLQTAVQRLNELTPGRKLALAVAVAAGIALIVALWLWSRAPDYRVLFSNLSERDGGAVIAALQQMNVPYRTEAGGAILVPADQVYDLRFRLAGQGLPRGGAVGFELMDAGKLGMTQFQEQVAYQRALEGELARTIQSLAPVENARVHLAIPKPSVFVREQQKPTASVLVSLYPGRSLDAAQVSAIVHLVASSVPNLTASGVTVVDAAGNLLSGRPDVTGLQGLNASQLDYLRQVEEYYARRIEAIVAPIVGNGNVRAEVRADLDFSHSEYTSETFKPNPTPEAQAIRSQQSIEETSQGNAQAAGVPGALTNQPPGPASAPLEAPAGANAGPATAGMGAGSSRRREATVNYEVDKTIRHVKEPLGRIKRLSVAVVINYRSQAGQGGQPVARPLSPQELAQINGLVKEAMGFNQERGDSVNVVNAAFTERKAEETLPLWKDPEALGIAKELVKNLLVFGLAFYLVFGVLRPLLRELLRPPPTAAIPEGGAVAVEAETPAVAAEQQPAESEVSVDTFEQRLREAREFARQNPRLAADVIRRWMSQS
ncbi:MAG: flagellar basal-body MS-ring/collar protein FliF [Thiobacillaceae bacterium]|nr:flagellar basal-body MS-ring/collar protein FliF [Thiobacillaceae bacterium]MDW8322495.1 flagellar basal-body MS-ring/collar protein FliF [Burkholderiales bacterium]